MTTKAGVRRPAPDKGEARVQDTASDGPEADAQALQELLEGLTAAARGDFSVRLRTVRGAVLHASLAFVESRSANASLCRHLDLVS